MHIGMGHGAIEFVALAHSQPSFTLARQQFEDRGYLWLTQKRSRHSDHATAWEESFNNHPTTY